MYAMANEEAIREYQRLIKNKGIKCGFERVPAYLYTKQDALSLKKEAKAAEFLSVETVLTKEINRKVTRCVLREANCLVSY